MPYAPKDPKTNAAGVSDGHRPFVLLLRCVAPVYRSGHVV